MRDAPQSMPHPLSLASALREYEQSVRAKCVHPSRTFIPFEKEEIEQSIPDRFEQQVRRYPNRLAVKGLRHELTYDELNQAANRVAATILERCGTRDEPIAVLLGQDGPVSTVFLAVLKIGKIYLHLDPSYPQARLTDILNDSGARLIVTDRENLSQAGDLGHDGRTILSIGELEVGLPSNNPGLRISPGSLGCILYTSGSSGQPKGVAHTHRSLLHTVRIFTNTFHICAEDRQVLLSSPGAAAAVWFGLRALANGAAVFPFDIREQGLHTLANWLIENGITIFSPPRGLFHHFVGTSTGMEEFPKIRLLTLGGESVSKRDVELYGKHFPPDTILVIGFGTTEAGRITQYFIDKNTEFTEPVVPVGFAEEDTQILLLDDTGREVGADGIGEIAVKSRYLSPGYWQRPDLTRNAFLPDPAGGDERIYLTGDLGRMLPDGCLVHLGRKGFQIKVRGYRVDVAEIEQALLRLDSIKEAVVLQREDSPGDTRLVAYLVPARKPAPTISSMRGALSRILPEYMVPSAFVTLGLLPLTPNGKIDRNALPAPNSKRAEMETPFIPPHAPVEKKLAEIWSTVLGLEAVGVQDNFLELGGDSLRASAIISRVVATFNVEIPVRSLFESPTIAEMAALVSQGMPTTVQIHSDTGGKRPPG